MSKTVELMDIKELSQFLRCSEQHIYNSVSKRKRGESNFPLPCFRGEGNLWLKEAVEDWLLQLNREVNSEIDKRIIEVMSDAS